MNIDSLTPKKTNPVKPKMIVFPLYYFYRSLRVVLLMWILLLSAIVFAPWADYYIKTSIKKEVLGVFNAVDRSSDSPKLPVKTQVWEAPSFSLIRGDLEIKAPIVSGTEEDQLKQGIGHQTDSVWPSVRGNMVLAGHSFSTDALNPYGQVFGRLREVEIGDQATVNFKGKKYVYKVFKKETVSSDETSFLGQSDDWILTFYTCDPPKTDWRRLVFQAELVGIE